MELSDLQAIVDAERAGRRPIQVRVCSAEGCLSSNARGVRQRLEDATARAGLGDRVQVCEVGCLRLCSEGPLVRVEPEGSLYQQVTPEQADSIIGTLTGGTTDVTRGETDGPFFARQHSIVLENCGVVEPERIESYIAAGGYQPLHHALREMSPAEVVESITKSRPRASGSAAHPARASGRAAGRSGTTGVKNLILGSPATRSDSGRILATLRTTSHASLTGRRPGRPGPRPSPQRLPA